MLHVFYLTCWGLMIRQLPATADQTRRGPVVNVTMAGCSRYLSTNPKDSPADAGKPNCSLFWWKTKAVSNPNAWLLRDSPRSQTNMIHVILQVPLVTCQVSSQNRGTPFHPLVQHYFQHKRNCFMGVPHSDTSICFKFLSYHVDLKKTRCRLNHCQSSFFRRCILPRQCPTGRWRDKQQLNYRRPRCRWILYP